MKIAIAGLGRMGSQIAHKLCDSRHEVIANNRSPEPIDAAVAQGAIGAYKKEDVIKHFGSERVIIWLMIPSEITTSELKKWLAILPKGSLIIDGGNTKFTDTKVHAKLVADHGSSLVDIGTSGGVWGYKNGFSMMAGGDKQDFKTIEPILKSLSEPSGGYAHFGPSGAGHFVKMVHNAIEYGMMESLAEGYRVLKEGPYENIDLAAAGQVWQQSSVVTSWLNELTRQALSENPELKGIGGVVAESGEARWTLETAKELGLPLPAIEASFDVRLKSQAGETNFATKLLSAMRAKFGGHEINPE